MTNASTSSERLANPSAAQVDGVMTFRHPGSLASRVAAGAAALASGSHRAQRTPDLRSVRHMRCAIARSRSSSAGCGSCSSNPKGCGAVGRWPSHERAVNVM